MHIQRKRAIAAAIATLLAAPALTTSVSADDPASSLTGLQSQNDASNTWNTERASGTGTSQPGSTYGSGAGTTSGSAGTGAGTGSTRQSMRSGLSSDSTGDSGRTTASTTSMGSGLTGQMAANPLYGRSVDELKGTGIVNATGDKIGDVKEIVLSKDRRSAHAVIGVGGFLGTGERDIAVSLEELETREGNELQMSATRDQINARPQYQSEQYTQVEGDQAISGSIIDFAAFETDRDSSTGARRGGNAGTAMDTDLRVPSIGTSTSTGINTSRGTGATNGAGSSTTNK